MGLQEHRSNQNVDLRGVVAGVRERVVQDLARVEVEEIVDPDVRGRGDPLLVAQIVYHLTTNAIQAATSLSSPRVRFHVYSAGDAAIVSVRDNGPGIPDELREKVFEPFFTTRRDQGATGLGLALCREHALRMGARLSFWSAPGRGTCVRLTLSRH
jgi:signal transduction histidine kinase